MSFLKYWYYAKMLHYLGCYFLAIDLSLIFYGINKSRSFLEILRKMLLVTNNSTSLSNSVGKPMIVTDATKKMLDLSRSLIDHLGKI